MVLIALAGLVLTVGVRGLASGSIPAGSAGFFKSYRPTRQHNPVAFHSYLALYLCGGAALAIWGILVWLGVAGPLKWD